MSKYNNQAKERADWIWSMHEKNGHVSTLEIKQQFGRAGRELENELLSRGIDLPPLITESEAIAQRQSEALIKAAGDQSMNMKQIAKVLKVKSPSQVSAALKKLRRYGLPCPKVKKIRKSQADICDVELPERQRVESSSYYPSGLQYSFKYQEEINGQLRWVYRLR